MAQLNWRPGMWPSRTDVGWDYPNSLLGRIGVVDGPMKRTPSNQSMSAMSDNQPMMNMWPPPHMMHPAMVHPSAMG